MRPMNCYLSSCEKCLTHARGSIRDSTVVLAWKFSRFEVGKER